MSTCQTSIKRPIYNCSTAEAQILGPARPHEITTVIPIELTKVFLFFFFSFFLFFSFISLIADGPHHYHPACGHKGSSHLSPVHALTFFYRVALVARVV